VTSARPQAQTPRRVRRLAVVGVTAAALAAGVAAAGPAQAAPTASTTKTVSTTSVQTTSTLAATKASAAKARAAARARAKARAFAHAHPRLHVGSKGKAVRKLQKYVAAKVTGKFNGATRTRVKKVQRSSHLKATGVVNYATWHAAYKYYVKHKKSRAQRLAPANVIKMARKYDGGRYVYGGTTPRGFDCSGYTMYVFHKLGVSLPHNSGQQYRTVKHISRKSARAGDLIFFHHGSHIYHVGIYAGHGGVYHASHPGRRTGYEHLWTSAVWFGRAA
jgi:cell wall-associated NlpC family hydrolase